MKKLLILILAAMVINCSNLYKKGDSYLNSGDYDNAVAEFEKIIEKFPDDWQAYYGLGQAYRMQKEFLKAVEAFDNALQLNPGWEEAVSAKRETVEERGDYYTGIKRYDTALEIYNEILEQEPDNVQLHLKIAGIFEKREDFDLALAKYEKIAEKFPGNETAVSAISRLKDRGNEYDKFFKTAEGLYEKNSFDKASENYEKALKERPDLKEAEYKMHLSKGRAYIEKSRKDRDVFILFKAIEQFTLASNVYPEKGDPYYYLGISHNRRDKSDYDAAIEQFKKALSVEPDFENAADCKKKLAELEKLKKFWGK